MIRCRSCAWRSALLVVGLAACSGGSLAGDDTGLEPLVGEWRGVLLTQGGDLPFAIQVNPEGSEAPAVLINAGVETAISTVTRQGAASYTLVFAATSDSEIVARMSPTGGELSGYWRYTADDSAYAGDDPGPTASTDFGGLIQMPFSARKNDGRRFPRNDPALDVATAEGIAALPDISGNWRLRFEGPARPDGPEGPDGGKLEALSLIQVDEHVIATPGGAHPAMEGIYRDGLLRLSVFDGAHALMMHGWAQPDGTLRGTLWAVGGVARAWTAQRR